MPRQKPAQPSTEPHAADRAAVRTILDEARDEEIVRLAHSPADLPEASAVAAFGEIKVQELDGSRVALGSLWKERPAAVVWLRHYG